MNFLDICKKVNQLGQLQGSLSSVSATGYQGELVEVVRKSFLDIQLYRKDWNFLKQSITFSTVEDEYSNSDVAEWKKDMILYGHRPLQVLDFDTYSKIDLSQETPGIPAYVTIRPNDKALLFNPLDAEYSITAHYYRKPQELVNNTDIPILPSEHHYLIVYAALSNLTSYISSDIYQVSLNNYNIGMGQLMRKELPGKSVRMRPLA